MLIDDEERASSILRTLIEKNIPEISELEIVNNATDAFFRIREFSPDLVFLDIQMPFLNGFDLLSKMEQISFDVIFTTAYNQYAIQAIRFSALDYLLKPIDVTDLRNAVQRHLNRKQTKSQTAMQYQNLFQNLSANSNEQFSLAVNGSQGMQFFQVNEIIRLEGDRNYTNFFLTKSRKLLSSKTLKEYEEMLSDKGFIRAHKSHLVNRSYIRSLTPECKLILTDESEVEVSRRRFPDVKLAVEGAG